MASTDLLTDTRLANWSQYKPTSFVGRLQRCTCGAIGLKMYCYNLIPGGSTNEGIPRCAGTAGQLQAVTGDNLPTQSIAAYSVPGAVDTTGRPVAIYSKALVGLMYSVAAFRAKGIMAMEKPFTMAGRRR